MRARYFPLILLFLASCDDRPNQWDAYITYTDDPERSEIIEGFRSYELCRAASLARIKADGSLKTGYFECGYKCGFNPKYGIKLCQETRD